MAHWFHRNPLKATSPVTYELRTVTTSTQSQKICTELRHARSHLLDVISNPNNEQSVLEQAVTKYFSLLDGFVNTYDDSSSGDSKMRHMIKFRWTNTLLGNKPTEQQDMIYEIASMLCNVGLWFTKHASQMAAKDEPSMEEAKEVHKCLRTAAGIFTHIKDTWVTKLFDVPEKGTDLDGRILSAYIHQCTAEAQEVTIARAIELKHKSTIVSALAYETATMFQDGVDALASFEEVQTAKWRRYLQFKIDIYMAYAYNYHGETLLAEDKCGEAIKCLQTSQSHYNKATVIGKEYSGTKGPGTTAKPHEHLFFRKLGPVVGRTLEKCVRENGFIYHQKVPPEIPQLDLKATYGLAAPEEFKYPETSPMWNAGTYKEFDISLKPSTDPKKEKEEKGDLPPVKEADISQSNKDPNNSSGCQIS